MEVIESNGLSGHLGSSQRVYEFVIKIHYPVSSSNPHTCMVKCMFMDSVTSRMETPRTMQAPMWNMMQEKYRSWSTKYSTLIGISTERDWLRVPPTLKSIGINGNPMSINIDGVKSGTAEKIFDK